MKITVDVPSERISNLLISACEGGSNYWCESATLFSSDLPKAKRPGHWYEDGKMFEQAITIKVVEHESSAPDGTGRVHLVQLRDIEAALKIMAEKYARHFGDMLSENDDATTGDVLLQLMTFKEIVYG